jgi:carbon monoxide dehydrogenase subunit G
MLKLTGSVCIDAPAPKVWSVLSDLESIHLWVESIERSYCPAQRRGVGATRVCELKQATIRETIVAWEEGRSFRYDGQGAPMMKRASNTWSIASQGSQTLVTSLAEVELKGGFVGRLMEPAIKAVFGRLGARSLAALKYFVEHGRPFDGPSRDLPPGPALC